MLQTRAIIAGIDEAGRGPLAGPVMAGACVLTDTLFRCRRSHPAWSPLARGANRPIIADSKCLSPEERETAYAWITAQCAWGVGAASAAEIDRNGILAATERAMQRALSMLERTIEPTFLLIDGRDHFWFDYPHASVIRGDSTEPCIAAASIIAKVTRDRWMCERAVPFPAYGFERHKGYGSTEHLKAIREHGPCELHRGSFLRRIRE